jgi:hypothetical protein
MISTFDAVRSPGVLRGPRDNKIGDQTSTQDSRLFELDWRVVEVIMATLVVLGGLPLVGWGCNGASLHDATREQLNTNWLG